MTHCNDAEKSSSLIAVEARFPRIPSRARASLSQRIIINLTIRGIQESAFALGQELATSRNQIDGSVASGAEGIYCFVAGLV
jgi:hypothetical protein